MDFKNVFGEVKIRHVIFMYIVSIIVCVIFSALLIKIFHVSYNDNLMNILILLNEILICIFLFYKLKISNNIIKKLYVDFKNKVDLKEIAFVVSIHILIAIGAGYVVMLLIYLISPTMAINFMFETPIIINNIYDYIISGLFLIVFSPIVEELIFRHIFFKRFSEKFNMYIGFIVSSIIFASLNIESGMIGALVFALLNCFLYIKYKNILFPIAVHVINNVLALLILIPGYKYLNNLTFGATRGIVINIFVSGVLLIIGIVLFVMFIIKNKKYLVIE